MLQSTKPVTNGEKNENCTKRRDNDPAGSRDLSPELRDVLTVAARALEALIERKRLLKRLHRGVRLRLKTRERRNIIDRLRFRRSFVRQLVFVGFPRIRARRRVFVIQRRRIRQRRVIVDVIELRRRGRRRQRKFRPAKTAEIALIRVYLSTILTMHNLYSSLFRRRARMRPTFLYDASNEKFVYSKIIFSPVRIAS